MGSLYIGDTEVISGGGGGSTGLTNYINRTPISTVTVYNYTTSFSIPSGAELVGFWYNNSGDICFEIFPVGIFINNTETWFKTFWDGEIKYTNGNFSASNVNKAYFF